MTVHESTTYTKESATPIQMVPASGRGMAAGVNRPRRLAGG